MPRLLLLYFMFGLLTGCTSYTEKGDLSHLTFTTPHIYSLSIPSGFPKMEIPADNPMTQEGVDLGRQLFYDPILSVDSSIACSSCHLPSLSFTDRQAKSSGVNGAVAKRSSPSLINVGFLRKGLFWDARVHSLEAQALLPVEDALEMQANWPDIELKLQRHPDYPSFFRAAFGIEDKKEITRDLVVKAIAQFERTLISSGNSKYDRVQIGLDTFTLDEAIGYDLFFDLTPEVKDAECGNCHNAPLFTDHTIVNNGIEKTSNIEDFPDKGLGAITGDQYDNGKFKVPTLYNIALTAPYMHDGRFKTLKEVIHHYNIGGQTSLTIHPIIRPLDLTEKEQEQLLAFLHTLTDSTFVEKETAAQLRIPK